MGSLINKITNPYQTGFLSRRFIAENGIALQMILEQAQYKKYKGVGVLLDQEKAYDRIHPRYLEKFLLSFQFPKTFISCIISLFFNNKMQINVNGFFTDNIQQKRGLR